MDDAKIPLAEVLHVVTREIQQAHRNAMAAGQTPVMKFESCEFEFAVDVEAKAGGGFQVWVMQLSGGVKRTESNTMKIQYRAIGDWVAPVEGPGGTLGEQYERIGEPPSK
jgi:hypothetical protein